MSYKWVYSTSPGKESVLNLQEELNVPEIIAYLLGLRKIDNYQKAKSFFRPDTSLLYNPFLMQDMEAGACRLSTAIRNHERVVIYGDYRSEEHTSELQSRGHLVCRLLLEKKKKQ